MALPQSLDVGQYISAFYGGASADSGAPALIVADSTTDNTEVEGATVDRRKSNGDIASSALVAVPWFAHLSENETATITVERQDSSDASLWNTASVVYASTVVATGEAGGTDVGGVIDINENLGSLAQYIRYNVTVDLSQADIPDDDGAGPHTDVEATDSALFCVVVVLGGYKILSA